MQRHIMLLFILGLFTSSAGSYAQDTVDIDKIVITASRIAQHDYKIA